MNPTWIVKTKSRMYYIEQKRSDLFVLRDTYGKRIAIGHNYLAIIIEHVGLNCLYYSYESYVQRMRKSA